MRVIVTGGSGFIGSAVIRLILAETDWRVLNVDRLGYAAVAEPCPPGLDRGRYGLVQADIRDRASMAQILAGFDPDLVIHAAAETHVDRSIDGPAAFVETNMLGTFAMLEAARAHWAARPRTGVRFHLVSTDEVFGSLEDGEPAFGDRSPILPNSPYAASKAGADHLVRAWGRTYGLPVSITRGCNTLGPWQFPEKLVPLMTIAAMERRPLPLYGDGLNRREWLHVDDHARAILAATAGPAGGCWPIGAGGDRTNREVVEAICDTVDALLPDARGSRRMLVRTVPDRPGHDRRYAMDDSRTRDALGWRPRHDFASALASTVRWYLENAGWWRRIRATSYGGERLGLTA